MIGSSSWSYYFQPVKNNAGSGMQNHLYANQSKSGNGSKVKIIKHDLTAVNAKTDLAIPTRDRCNCFY